MVAALAFRDDLYYRINVFPIESPALRERREDIPALAFHFVQSFSAELGKNVDEISEGAMSLLTSYDWPGNVRELENALHRATILATDNVLREAHLLGIMETGPDHDAAGAADRRGAQATEEGRARKERRAHRTALRARRAQAQRLESVAERQGHRHAALELSGAHEEAQHPRGRRRCGRGRCGCR